MQNKLLASYLSLLSTAYAAGARNFLLHTVPPVGRSPGDQLFFGPVGANMTNAAVACFNAAILDMAAAFRAAHPAATVFVHDTHALFAAVLDNPRQFEQTAGLKVLDTFCLQYAFPNTINQPYATDPACTAPVNQYFWEDYLHVTWPFHRLLAFSVATLLG